MGREVVVELLVVLVLVAALVAVLVVVSRGDAVCSAQAARMTSSNMHTRRVIAATVSVIVLALGACGSNAPTLRTASVPTITTVTTSPAAAVVTTRATTRATTTRPKPRSITLPGITGRQAIVVTAAHYSDKTATLTAYQRSGDTWTVAFGPWTANVGAKGVAPPGEKREGDKRTPSGTYGFDFMFGVQPDPGVKFAYRRITGENIVWVEDVDSPHYNQWIDSNEYPDEADQDNMYKPTVYAHGAVIAYNTAARTPGLGSGIFLHVAGKGATAGCVSLPIDRLRSILRWLDPAAAPVIRIGVSA